MLRLLPVKPPRPLQFSSRAQPALIGSMRFSPAFWPFGRKTSQVPTQKSNCRYSALWQAGGGGAGGVGACAAAKAAGTASMVASSERERRFAAGWKGFVIPAPLRKPGRLERDDRRGCAEIAQ